MPKMYNGRRSGASTITGHKLARLRHAPLGERLDAGTDLAHGHVDITRPLVGWIAQTLDLDPTMFREYRRARRVADQQPDENEITSSSGNDTDSVPYNGNGHADGNNGHGESLASRLLRSSLEERIEAARTVGADVIWDTLLLPVMSFTDSVRRSEGRRTSLQNRRLRPMTITTLYRHRRLDRAAVVTTAIVQIIRAAPTNLEHQLENLLRDEFSAEHEQAVAERELPDDA